MTRNEALQIAKANRTAHMNADCENGYRKDLWEQYQRDFGYRHGWYRVGEFNFCHEDLTGEKYDITQGGWAFTLSAESAGCV